MLTHNWSQINTSRIFQSIFFGFSSALLGITGFETSANYIEEQREGVFPKTLRNMWFIVAIVNPLTALLALGLLDIDYIIDPNNCTDILATMGEVSGGSWLKILVSVDATIVLAGSVLTAYVGVGGLVRRMSMDRCLPQFLLQMNPWRKTYHFIILGFFALTSSLFLLVSIGSEKGNINILSGVFTIAFLGVMSLFGIGNILLKYKRSELPRKVKAPWISVIIAIASVITGLIGQIIYSISYVMWFSIYFVGVLLVVLIMLNRIRLLRITLFFLKKKKITIFSWLSFWIQRQVKEINNMPIIYFTKSDDLEVLHKAVVYVVENELTNWLRVVHIYKSDDEIPKTLEQNVKILDQIYPKCRIDLVLVKGSFSPDSVDYIASELKVAKNFMFIACPGSRFPQNISDYGGVRVITRENT